jgi:glycosyltransferase involved in cell wall biosynthesis
MVSIVIPVYNAENSLRKCLDSLIGQTFTDYEIILINDGSKDKSQEIIDEYAEKYPTKIRSYTQVNCGVAVTRNRGIGYAEGEYLLFIDNDDYVKKDYIEKYVNEIRSKNVDVVIGGYKRVDLKGKNVIH